MYRFDLNDLALLSMIADERQLTRAAQRACLSTPAASLRIKRLEESLGVTLFNRMPGGLETTPAGECVNTAAKDIANRLDRLTEELDPYVRLKSGTIRIVGNYGASMDFLPKVISSYLIENPTHNINLDRRSSEEVVEMISNGRADIGVCVPVSRRKNVRFIPYMLDHLVLIVPEKHPLAVHDEIWIKDAIPYEFVVLNPNVSMQAYVHQKLREMGLAVRRRLEADDQHVLMQFVRSGLGIGVLTLRTTRFAPEGIKVVRIRDEWSLRPLKVIVPDDEARLTDKARLFLRYLLEKNPDADMAD